MTASVETESVYYDEAAVSAGVAAGHHRDIVGGMWDQIGQLQFEFLVGAGLQPHHCLLDVGCGSFRGGVHFARYLNTGNYHGLDINHSLIDAGYVEEFAPLGLDKKVPRANLVSNDRFDFSPFARRFDFALALSLFTHLPLNNIRTCLEQLTSCLQPRGRFFATVFEAPAEWPTHISRTHDIGGVVTFGDRDPYHYRPEDIAYIASSAGWVSRWIGDFSHPRNQMMVEFTLGSD